MVRADGEALHIHPAARRRHLIAHHLVTRANRFKAIASVHVFAGFDANFVARADPIAGLERTIKGNFEFIRRAGPRARDLRNVGPRITDFEQLSFASRPGPPMGIGTLALRTSTSSSRSRNSRRSGCRLMERGRSSNVSGKVTCMATTARNRSRRITPKSIDSMALSWSWLRDVRCCTRDLFPPLREASLYPE